MASTSKRRDAGDAGRPTRRVNRRALIVLGGVVLLGVLSFVPLRLLSDQATRRSALDQIEESVKTGQVDLALRNLENYTAAWPEDIPGLELQAKLLADNARTGDAVLRAARANDQLLRLDPSGKGRQETRRRLVRLYIIQSYALRRRAEVERLPGEEWTRDLRYQAAATIGRQMIAADPKDAEAHFLLAQALEGTAGATRDRSATAAERPADPKGKAAGQAGTPLAEAVANYEEALRLDPGNLASAQRLAQVYLERRNDPAKAEATLDALLKARPADPEARLVRYEFFAGRSKRRDLAEDVRAEARKRAGAELDAALAIAPESVVVRKFAATDAFERLDFAEARRQLAAIPEASQSDVGVRLMRGHLEQAEQHPDEAIDQWRKGLAMVAGGNLDLTWQLASMLIDLGRIAEARPLVSQIERLEGDERRTLAKFLQAKLEQAAGKPHKAIEDLEKIRERLPEGLIGDAELILARCHEKLGDEVKAKAAYLRAKKALPEMVEPRRAIARLESAANPRAALGELEQALARSPADTTLLFDVGRLRLMAQIALPAGQRNWDGIEEVLAQAEKAAPANPALLTLRADYLAASGRGERAAELLAAAAAGPDRRRPEIWVAYAAVLNWLGRVDEAEKALAKASGVDEAGDHVALRILRAKILVRLGRAQAAREILSKDPEKLPKSERPELSHALGELLRELGDRAGARAAFADWARLAPDSPEPGFSLLAMAKVNNDDEAARLGLEALRAVGGDQEPYGLAARAYELLRTDADRPGVAVGRAKLEEAGRLVARLEQEAPMLPATSFLRGMIQERTDRVADAIKSYRGALKGATQVQALERLLELLAKQGRFDDIAELNRQYQDPASLGADAALSRSFGQISAAVAIRLGDKARAEQALAKVVEAQPENLQAVADQVTLLAEMGRPRDAEQAIRALVGRRPADAEAWRLLVTFQSLQGEPGTAAATVGRLRSEYKGDRPEKLLARCRWIVGDLDAAAKLYREALAAHPDDLATIRDALEFDEATGRSVDADAALRRARKADPSATWAARSLAIRLSARPDPAAWAEAWSLIAPGVPGSGEAPEDRLVRATVLARSPDFARRAEAVPAMTALAEDLPPTSPIAIEARVRLARSLLDANKPADAAKILDPVADAPTPNPIALALSAEALARAGRPDEAGRRIGRLEALDPNSTRTATAKAWAAHAAGKPAEAAAAIDAVVAAAEAPPGDEAKALACHDILLKIGQPADAEKVAARVAARWPRHSDLLARYQIARGEAAAAMGSCRTALAAGAPLDAVREATTLAVTRRNDPGVLREVDALAAAARPKLAKSAEFLVYLATIRHLQDRYADEMALYREALAANPQSVRFLNNMAWTLCEGQHDYDEALARVDELIRREGTAAAFLDTRGVILMRLGRLDEAIANLEDSARRMPDPATYFHLARAYLKAGKAADHARVRDLARKGKLDPTTLDPADLADLAEVMGKP